MMSRMCHKLDVTHGRSQTRYMKLVTILVLICTLISCSSSKSEGNIAIFCARLDSGSAKGSNATPEDLAALVEVAPPEIKSNVEALYNRTQDFEALLAQDPPDLKALFHAKFDPGANVEQRAFDVYAQEKCSITILRSSLTKWNSYLARHHHDAIWTGQVGAQFDRQGEMIAVATLVFSSEPELETDIEAACAAVQDFLISDGATEAAIQIVVDTSLVATAENPKSECTRVE